MTDKHSAAATLTQPSDREIVITRTFDAPRWLVFDAFTKPEHLVKWWGLRSHRLVVCEIDLRVGGKWRFVSRAPDGSEYGFSGEYREIVPPERLVSTEGYEAMPGHDYLVTATFADEGGKTRMTMTHSGLPAGEMGDMTGYGWNESFDKLAESLHEIQQEQSS